MSLLRKCTLSLSDQCYQIVIDFYALSGTEMCVQWGILLHFSTNISNADILMQLQKTCKLLEDKPACALCVVRIRWASLEKCFPFVCGAALCAFQILQRYMLGPIHTICFPLCWVHQESGSQLYMQSMPRLLTGIIQTTSRMCCGNGDRMDISHVTAPQHISLQH